MSKTNLSFIENPDIQEDQDCCSLSLVELVRRIVYFSYRFALREFHENRTVFQGADERNVRLIDYVQIRLSCRKHDDPEVLQNALDLTVDKFTHFPDESHEQNSSSRKNGRRLDCRNNFRAFLEEMERKASCGENTDELKEEAMAARTLQGLVDRHIRFSILDCKRRQKNGFSRYDWMVQDHRLILYLPVHLHGSERRNWLETNIPDVNPTRAGEKQRVQAIIDSRFKRLTLISSNETEPDFTDDPILGLISSKGLPQAVAREKSDTIDQQRPAIQKLGADKLYSLILRIFEAIAVDRYNLSAIAREFHLSKASLCRFAAKRWYENQPDEPNEVPDLWRNTSQILASHPDFIESALETGIWKDIQDHIPNRDE